MDLGDGLQNQNYSEIFKYRMTVSFLEQLIFLDRVQAHLNSHLSFKEKYIIHHLVDTGRQVALKV